MNYTPKHESIHPCDTGQRRQTVQFFSHCLEDIGFHPKTKLKSFFPCRFFPLLTPISLICTFHHSSFLILLLFMKVPSNNLILRAAPAPICSSLTSFQYLKYRRQVALMNRLLLQHYQFYYMTVEVTFVLILYTKSQGVVISFYISNLEKYVEFTISGVNSCAFI